MTNTWPRLRPIGLPDKWAGVQSDVAPGSRSKWFRLLLLATCHLAIATSFVRGGDVTAAIPERLIIYSIEKPESGNNAARQERFRGYRVPGKTEITDRKQIDALFKAITDGVSHAKREDSAFCFNPQHGVRTVRDGKSVDYLICFHCRLVHRFDQRTDDYRMLPITEEPKAALNAALKVAKIELLSE
jgi:hypothetical protein